MKRSIIILAASTCLIAAALAKESSPMSGQHDITAGHKPKIAADKNGVLHVVYEASKEGANATDIFYSESTDGGVTWSAGKDISYSHGTASDPDIAVESTGALDVVWTDTSPGEQNPDIFAVRSADGGKTWTDPVDISNTPTPSNQPAVACGPDDSVHAVWIDTFSGPTHVDVWHTFSTNAGKTWSNPEDISPTPGISSEPAITIGKDGTIHSAWVDTTSGVTHPDIFYVRYAGGAWTQPVDVSHTFKVCTYPCMATGPKSRVYLCWQDNSKKEHAADIWCAIAGKSAKWGKALNISNTPGVSSEPAIAADQAGRIAVVWSDTTTGVSRPDVCVRVSLDSGETFSNQMNMSNTLTKSKFPSVTLIGSKLFVVWEEIAPTTCTIKTMSMELKGIPTGPVEEVEGSQGHTVR